MKDTKDTTVLEHLGSRKMEQETILEQPQTMDEALRLVQFYQEENQFLKRQIEVFNTMQAKAGLVLNKITITELFEKKLLECKARELSRTRLLTYGYAEHYFTEWCKLSGYVYADEITTDHTHEFWEWFKVTPGIHGKILSESSRVHTWTAIKSTFQYAKKRNSIISNPFEHRPMPLNPVDDWWDDVYFYKLTKAIEKFARTGVVHKFQTIIRLLYTTGLRIGLLLGVKHSGVKVTPDGRVFITTKRKIPKSSRIQEVTIELINKKAKEMFLHYYIEGEEGFVLINNTTKPEHYASCLRDAFKGEWLKEEQIKVGICEKAGLLYKSFQKAKHGFVTKMLERGYTSTQICKMTGNSDPTVIDKIYNHIQVANFIDRIKADLEDL